MPTLAYDFKLTADEDLDLSSGDIQIVPSDDQHKKDILNSMPGWWKRAPLVGWGALMRVNSKANKQEMLQSATIMLTADGYVKGPNGFDFDLTENGEIKIKMLDFTRP